MPRRVKLSKAVVVKLITEVSRRPCLWNVENIHYKDRQRVSRAWHSISSRLNLREDIVRAKWRNLRDTLNKELKKYDMKSGDKYPGMWRYFKRLHFMHKHFSAKCSDNEDYNRTNSILHHTTHDIYADESDDATLYEDQNIPDSEYFEVNDNSSKSKQNPEDFDLMFLKSLLPFFRGLESHRKLKVRSQIQDLIFHEFADEKILIGVAGVQ
nr:uncharacterized protein LOC117988001 [Maniola hyperantus]